jgi:multicomponent Na+:H+ antiporter subunit B
MSPRARLVMFAVGAVGLFVLFGSAIPQLPEFGGAFHPYRDLAVGAALRHNTENAVSSVNFDLRPVDNFGEELIFLASAVGAATLLRATGESRQRSGEHARVMPLTALGGYLLLPLVFVVGANVVLHGHLTPGGGFQGGVVLATGLHLLYVAGDLRALSWCVEAEAAAGGAFALIGLAGSASGAGFLGNALPTGSLGTLLSAGTVPLLNLAVGCEVGAGIVVLLAQFLHQALVLTRPEP